jgi:hypothetical protein
MLAQAVQQLALVLCDDAYDALPGLAIPLNPGSRPPLLLAVAVTAHALAALPREEATLSRRLLAGMILLAEQQVLSTLIQVPQHSYIGDLVSHPNDQDQRSAHAETEAIPRTAVIAWPICCIALFGPVCPEFDSRRLGLLAIGRRA